MTIIFDDIIKSVEEDNLAFVKDVHELFLNKRGSSGAEIDMFAPYQPYVLKKATEELLLYRQFKSGIKNKNGIEEYRRFKCLIQD